MLLRGLQSWKLYDPLASEQEQGVGWPAAMTQDWFEQIDEVSAIIITLCCSSP